MSQLTGLTMTNQYRMKKLHPLNTLNFTKLRGIMFSAVMIKMKVGAHGSQQLFRLICEGHSFVIKVNL